METTEEVTTSVVTETPPPATAAPPPPVVAGVTAADAAAAVAAAEAAAANAERLMRASEEATARAAEAAARLESFQASTSTQAATLERIEARERRSLQQATIQKLRAFGADPRLSDEHLLRLAPVVDPTTGDGVAALDAWREANASLFAPRPESQVAVAQRLAAAIPAAPGRKLFGDEWVRTMVSKTFGGES